MKNIILLALAFLAFAFAQVSWAQSKSPGAGWVQGVSSTGQKVWFGPSTLTKSSAGMGQAIWDSAMSGGGAKFNLPAKLAVGAGEVAVVGKAVVTGANVFAAFRAATGGSLGIALLAAPAIVDWLNQAKVRPTPSGATHGKQFEMTNDDACSSNCYEYSVFDAGYFSPSATTAMRAAALYAARQSSSDAFSSTTFTPTSCTNTLCTFSVTQYIDGVLYGTSTATASVTRTPSGTRPPSWLPASMDDIAPYMTDRAASMAAIQAMLDHNAQFKFTSPSVTGPATVTGPSTVKTTPVPVPPPTSSISTTSGNPLGLPNNTPTVTGSSTGSSSQTVDGKPVSVPSKTTTTSTYNPTTNKTTSETVTSTDPHTVTNTSSSKSTQSYSTGPNPETGDTAPKVTSSTVTSTVTNITNNTTNTTTTVTSTETNPEKPTSDTPKPDEEKQDFCKENPDVLACAEADTPEGEIPKVDKEITYTPQNPFGGGSCPSDKYYTLRTGQSLKVVDWATPCGYIADYVRPVLILLGAWAAMMLLIPGRTES